MSLAFRVKHEIVQEEREWDRHGDLFAAQRKARRDRNRILRATPCRRTVGRRRQRVENECRQVEKRHHQLASARDVRDRFARQRVREEHSSRHPRHRLTPLAVAFGENRKAEGAQRQSVEGDRHGDVEEDVGVVKPPRLVPAQCVVHRKREIDKWPIAVGEKPRQGEKVAYQQALLDRIVVIENELTSQARRVDQQRDGHERSDDDGVEPGGWLWPGELDPRLRSGGSGPFLPRRSVPVLFLSARFAHERPTISNTRRARQRRVSVVRVGL